MEKGKVFTSGPQWTGKKVIGVSLVVLYNAAIVALLLFCQLQLSSMKEHYDYKFEEVEKKLEICQSQVSKPLAKLMNPVLLDQRVVNDMIINEMAPKAQDKVSLSADRRKREVLSTNKIDLSSLLKGRDGRDGAPGYPGVQGPPGRDGLPGKDGHPGKDAVNIAFVNHVINATVIKMASAEMNKLEQLVKTIPTVPGVTFVRWGQPDCPQKSSLIYKGRAGGSYHSHTGGSPQLLCMPDDPEYSSTATDGVVNWINGVEYEDSQNFKGVPANYHNVPCSLCQTDRRMSQHVFPAKLKCPDDSWVKDYSGLLMTSASGHGGRINYVCVDEKAQPLDGMAAVEYGAVLRYVGVQCGTGSQSGNLGHCPPYKKNSPVTCTICSK